MSKNLKNCLIFCLSIMLVFALTLFVACKETKPEGKLTISTTLTDKVVDVEKYVNIPEGKVVDKKGKEVDQKVKVKIYNPDGGIVSAWAGDFRVPDTGVWKVVYSSDNADDLTVKLTCQDLSAPEYVVNELNRFVYVNQSVNLSVFTFRDYSGVDAEKTSVKVQFKNGDTWTDCELSEQGDSFVPDKEGYYKVIATATDKIGKQDSYEFMLLAVSSSYKIDQLVSGYIASYDDVVYEYLIGSAGTINQTVGKTDPVVSYAGEVDGALNDSAIKVTVYKGENGATLRLILPEVASGSLDGKGDNLTLRFKGESEIVSSYINGNSQTENVAVIGEKDVNGWQIMNIPLSANGLNGSAYNIRSIELVLGEQMKDAEEWYFDFVKMSNILDLPEKFNYSYADQKLSWNAVDNAIGYEVVSGGQSYTITDTNINIPLGEKLKVKVLGDTANYLDSDWSNEFNALDIAKGFICEYNNAYFVDTIETSNNVNTWWAAGTVKSEYVASGVTGALDGDAMKTTASIKTEGGTNRTAINFNLPSVFNGTLSGEFIRARIKIENPTVALTELWWNGTPSTGIVSMVGNPDHNGWITINMPISVTNGLYGLKYLTMGFMNFQPTDTELVVYLDWVKAMEVLDTPANVYYDYETKMLKWDAVENATSYVVTYDGNEYKVNGTSASVPLNKQIAVKAVGVDYDDSSWSENVSSLDIEEGYLANFTSSLYESIITNDAGDTYWKADALTVEYVSQAIAGADDGDAIKLVADKKDYQNSNNASKNGTGIVGFNMAFPKINGRIFSGNIVQMRFHAKDGDNYAPMFLYYKNGVVVNSGLDISAPDSNGWRTLSISANEIAGGAENLTNLGIAFWPYSSSEGTCEIYLDWVRVVSALPTPSNLKYQGGVLSWTAVPNATSYVVKYDGVEHVVTTNSVSIENGKSVTIKAVGEGYSDSVWSSEFVTVNIPNGYIADYNNAVYESMVKIGHNDSDDYWHPTAISAKYTSGVTGAENGDALVVTITNNKNGYSAIRLNLPVVADGSLNGTTIQIKYRLMESSAPKAAFLYSFNSGAPAYNFNNTSADANGWITMSISVSDPYTVNSIGLGFYGLAKNGTSILEVDYVKVV